MHSLQTAHTSKMQKDSNSTRSVKPFFPQRKFKNATRLQNSFTAAIERKALLWLAARLPVSINSDHLTLLGFVAMFLAGCSYALARWNPWGLLLATLCLALNWFGDSLDGTLARVRNRQRPRYGFYVDHIIDSFGALFLMGGLALSGYIDWRIAMGLLVAFLLLSIESYLASYTLGIFRLSFAKFGPTEIRILLAIANTVLFFLPTARTPGWSHHLLDVGGAIAIVAMTAMAIFAAVSHTLALYRQETL
ncbi:MAG TPA: CDP-alcohol phosphatidyltransferase family protein [Candidatus Dormibacteraeota bacterium]|jgi:archaetidylinositol phosphate synthase|nr:CDP-alcohol phosphatidyltransferase family protein [Candidatus Dormibacteraeota bacterium]